MEGLRGGWRRKVGDGAGAHVETDPGARFRFQMPAGSSPLSRRALPRLLEHVSVL